ncbi:LOW QUALITY PROTEIN: low-density lipoprotein receptor-related protein 2a [Leucoraja erinacea]|uniref:LOW QUALITY PROTEIN: low-density lipoprotein receptor-related protein 2a n=1 Tax=Leucoraja erinaceus TaxID=7782 RepID=UPI0024569ED4|nr:LOW QUALITY PROTEIN: low-density lipoprotein receptor-related protein 2a [Leucoraja erinacea]
MGGPTPSLLLLITLLPVQCSSKAPFTLTCAADEFRCVGDGECIPPSWVCDAEEDCDDGSDERQHCPSKSCSSQQFTCINGECIPKEYRCDHVNDCSDGIDETGCHYPPCIQMNCANGACYNSSQHCDGMLNCRDGSDETNCTHKCSSGYYQCANEECIPRLFVCDHDDDCGDRSDEQTCAYPACSGDYFSCPSGHCIHQYWLCDGDDDCGDNADERGCERGELQECSPRQWICPGTQHCISLNKLCDGTQDCSDGGDETNSTTGNNCSVRNCAALSCEYHCRSSPSGGICFCPSGYILGTDARSCVDFDECNVWGACDQLCESKVGAYSCACVQGYVLEHHKHCRANASSGIPSIVFSNGRDLLIGNIHGRDTRILVESHNRGIAVGVDFHYNLGKIFWTDTIQNKVFSVNLDGTSIREILNVSIDTPENLAVDWVNDKLYVVETSINRIELTDLDGGNRITLIGENLGRPRGIALDPTVGYLFFSDWNDGSGAPKLERAFMDGSHRFEVVKSKLGWPAGISLDLITKRLYWVDSRYDYIETVTYDGLERKTVVSGGRSVPHPYGIANFEDKLFYTDWTKMAVIRVNKSADNNPQIIYQSPLKPYGVAVYHAFRQPFVKNPCGSNNGGCEHICILSHGMDNQGLGYRCRCKLGFDLYHDQKHCYPVTQFLLFSSQLSVRGIPFNISTQEDIILPVTGNPSYFVGIDFEAVERTIFFSDTRNDLICKQKIDGTGREVLVASRVDGVEDLAFDWISRNLYWTDTRHSTISVLRLADNSRRTIVKNLNNPRSIVVHPIVGYIFWTDWYRPAKVMRAWCDGSNAEPIVNSTLGWPNGLAIDWSYLRLYWVDAFFDKIEHSSFDGLNRQTLGQISQMSHPFGLTIFGDHVYFTDWRLNGIVRLHKVDGGGMTIIRRGIDNIMHVKSFDATVQTGSNSCNKPTNPNGDCSHFCFPTPNLQRVCGCPYGMKRDSNNLNCVEDPSSEVSTQQCAIFSFTCANGKCVPDYNHCDGVNDCHDNSDEANCGTLNTTCSSAAFTCSNHQCIPIFWRCDGQKDCFDASDEQECPTSSPASCSANYFTCTNSYCIPTRWVCDTDNDCGDGSDELSCNFTSSCPPEQFLCPEHRCIDPSYVCDGDKDCLDGLDEQGCVYNCTSYEFKCTSGEQCISIFYYCDGIFDCVDESDEAGCPTRPPGMCHQSEFQCQGDGTCLPSNWECDGHADCTDASDEHPGCLPRNCSLSHYRCDNGNCVPRDWLCDGDNDCRDMSDERDCPTQPFQCISPLWQCPGLSLCLSLEKICDRNPDCPNGADESPLCSTDSCDASNAGCTHGCFEGPFGAQCTCPSGYQLANDSKTCEDVDECGLPGTCSQMCYNQRGSFRCTCDQGYGLEVDQSTCKVSEGSDMQLMVASRGQIVSENINVRPYQIQSVIRGGRNIVAIDFDSQTGRIYWSDVTQDKVWSAFQNGTDQKVIFDSGVTITENIAVDWIGRNLYWADHILQTIEVSQLNGSHRTVLISDNITNPRGLVVDPRDDIHLMFWTDWGRNPRVERASMDGALRTVLINTKLYWPNGLCIDYPTKLLYFADAYLDYIEYCDYNGKNRRQVLASDLILRHPHAITIFEDFVYWTDRHSNRVVRVNKWNGKNQSVMISSVIEPLGITAVHSVRQPPAGNPCASKSCSHLCLLSASAPRFYSCVCPSGWKLMEDLEHCIKDDDPFLIVVRNNVIFGISLNPEDKSSDAMVPIAGVQNGFDVDFDEEDMIYWVENPGDIHRVGADGTNRTVFAPASTIGSPMGLAFDWISMNLYCTNFDQQSIEVIKVKGDVQYRRTILTNTGQRTSVGAPIGIVVNPAKGKLYWTDQGTESGIPAKIASANMDGTNARVLFTNNLDHVEFITIDIKERKLYWSISSTGVIERGDLSGLNRVTVVSHLSHPWGIAIYQGFLYYTDNDYEVIERVDKATGENAVMLRNNLAGLMSLRVNFRDKSAGSSNGCSNNLGLCEQLCLPRPAGAHKCACTTGFRMNPDNHSCSAINSFVVVSQLNVIRGFNLNPGDHSEAMVPVGGEGRFALHVDVHVSAGFIYWCDYSTVPQRNAIRRIKPDGSSFNTIVSSGIGQNGIRGIALDWVAGNLYFTNAFLTETYIEVVSLNTSFRRVLIKTRVDRPRHIVVNPKLRYIFWADYGQRPKIERAFLDGSNRSVLLDDGIVMPRGLTVDYTNDYIYWIDDSLDLIARVSPDGKERQIIRYGSRYPTPLGICIFENTMIWVDRNLKKVLRASKEPGNVDPPTVIRDNLDLLRDAVIFDRRAQPTSPQALNGNPCLENQGGCAQFCFALPGVQAARCGCAHGRLEANGWQCSVTTGSFLIFATESSVRSLHLDISDHRAPFPTIKVDPTAVALDYDSSDRRIYFTQSLGRGLSRISYISVEASTASPVQVITGLTSPDGIAFDWINRRLYYSDYLNQTINSVSINGSDRTVVANVARPRAIVLDPCRGYMFWTDWGTSPKIERATLGGSFRLTIINSSLVWPNGLTMDYDDQKLYWADASLRKIERSSLTGADREVIVSTAIYPFAVSIYEEYLYWTDWNTRSIHRVNKYDGSDQTVMLQNLPDRPMDIHVMSDAKQQQCSNPCDQFNGGCSHICSIGPHGPECQCPAHGNWRLVNNNKDCISADTAVCGTGYFTCLNGHCILERWKCDTDNDCGDRSDELERLCAFHTCAATAFTCNNGKCTEYRYRCDHYNDCGDNSDEVGCLFPTCDPTSDFSCDNGRCIKLSAVCNGANDCHDNSTSDERDCPPRTCQPGHAKCETTNICIPRTYLCDGDNDCGDLSDESPTHCVGGTCAVSEFRCTSGRCIPSHWYCDSGLDCADGSDEPTTCIPAEMVCSDQQFKCEDGRCIPSIWVCDGDNDCGDMSDEDQRHNCANRNCSDTDFTCVNSQPPQRRCIPSAWVCDGDSDCPDALDESQNCTGTLCPGEEFACDNGLCVRGSYRCDRRNDCGDASDERGCAYPSCTQHQFTCQNGRCISQLWLCDGDNDCGDRSDEMEHLCVTAQPTCPPQHFRCSNGACIETAKVCNQVDDCSDNSDERTCGVDECSNPELNRCTHICTNTQVGFLCSCPPGYQLLQDGQACEDVDECNETPGVCSQICENTEGSYICKCAPGHLREPDGRTCRQNSNITPYLLFSNRYYIRNFSVDGNSYTLVQQGLLNVGALDFDRVEQRLYWIDMGRRVMERMFLNETMKETVISHDLFGAEGLAVDWVGRKLYWADNFKNCLNVAELDGRFMKKLATPCLEMSSTYCFENPRAVALYPKYGYVFWSDWGDQAYIGRMGMDGRNASAIITSKLEWPNGITIDYTNDKLYWTDAHLNYIEFANLDGSHRHTVFDGTLSHPFAISLFEDTIYWTDWNTKSVEKANKYTGEGRVLLVNTTHTPIDILVYHPYRQPIAINPCGSNNGGCSHLCLIANGGENYTCECPDNFARQLGSTTHCVPMCTSTQYRCRNNERCIPIWWKCDGQKDCRDGSDEPSTCPPHYCRLGQFQCTDGNCTSPSLLCNGYQDCADESDEDAALCLSHQCESYQWQCTNKRCIPEAWQCDGENDCTDNSDEVAASCATRTCNPGQFKCGNGHCIPLSWKCDVDDDCGDYSDEPYEECHGPDYSCDSHIEFSCRTNYRCIPNWAVCNGNNDCRDNTDEQNCEDRTCNPTGDFRCDDHRCIPLRWRCDGDNDCSDDSDERDCSPRECSESEFRCDNMRCVPGHWVCDHYNDCEDNSDERDCELLTCLPGYFECSSGHCIPESFLCDGSAECADFSDETACPTRYPNGRYCPPFLFECLNHVCIQPYWKCDGDNDCGDGSDELLHHCLDIPCEPPSRFRCANNRCLYIHEVCNQVDDCGDGSDENQESCKEPTLPPCTTEDYKCGDGKCIPIVHVCDNYAHCDDQSDEVGCDHNVERTCAEKLCEHECTNLTDGGFICFCRLGYRVNEADANACDDINECEIFGTCPHSCKNGKGTYECFCAEGFEPVQEEQGILCAAKGGPPLLLLPDHVRIRRYSTSQEQYTDYIDLEENIKAIDYIWDSEDPDLSLVYWTALGHGSQAGSIKRAYLTRFDDKGSNPTVAVNLNLKYITTPDGIAVDWVGKHIYWTDSSTNRIEVAELDGRYRKWLVSSQLQQPAAISVNPKLGLFYWTDWGSEPKIESAWMDGDQRQVLATSDLGWPTGLTIDYLNGDRIYWSDSKENLIESMKPDGSDRIVIINGDLGNPFSLDLFENHLYWTSKENGEVWKQDKFGNGHKIKILTVNPWLTQARIYQENRYDHSVPNRCKGSCSHLCLLRPGGYTCACPEGTHFLDDSNSECDAAIESKQTMPPACKCRNEGVCRFEGNTTKCTCPHGYAGRYCQIAKSQGSRHSAATAVVLVIIIILILGSLTAAGAFINYKRTGSLLPPFPKLSSFISFAKPNGNGVTFRSGMDTGGECGASTIDIDSAIDGAMQMDENFVAEGLKQPVTFENPMFGSKAIDSSETPTVETSAVMVTVGGDSNGSRCDNPIYTSMPPFVNKPPSTKSPTQESKWSFFKRKPKPSTNFENPVYAESHKQEQTSDPLGESSLTSHTFETPSSQSPSKKDEPLTYSPTESTFKDTAALVKEDLEA